MQNDGTGASAPFAYTPEPRYQDPKRRKADLELLVRQYVKGAAVLACTVVFLRFILLHVLGHDLFDGRALTNRLVYAGVLVLGLAWAFRAWDIESIRDIGARLNTPLTARQLAIARYNGTLSPKQAMALNAARPGST
jgi:hypothetical protein